MLESAYRNKRVVVTGAASGMGAAAAVKLLAAGATVIGADVAAIATPGVDARHLDLADAHSVDGFIAQLADESIDALFHCAGLPHTFGAAKVLTVNFVGARYFLDNQIGRAHV